MIKKFLPVIFIILVTCLIFFKVFLKGLFPVPGDLLVSFYFPWYSGGWEGYDPWTTRKELLGADSIRQIYPWKEFAMEAFKKGKVPLWNPYTFSGQPLLANFQSSVFYPLNVFYFLTDAKNAWILLIVTQPILGGIFMYLLTRSLNLGTVSSVFGAIAFMFSSYLITWIENGNITHSYLWLPLSIWAINKFFGRYKVRYLVILVLSLSLSIFGGHPQSAIYVYLATIIYFAYKIFEKRESYKKLGFLVLTIFFSFGLTAIQLIPTYDFYQDSPISQAFAREAVFEKSILPHKNLLTFFASDFFGHPAANNFWSQSYGDFTPYFGVIPLVFALLAIFRLWKNVFVKFATIFVIVFIVSGVNGPITYLIKTFHPPLLDATTPARFISISIFLLVILAAFGFEDIVKNFQEKEYVRRFFKFLIPLGLIYGLFWLFVLVGQFFLEPKDTWQINLAVTRRNLILPTVMFLAIPLCIFALRFLKAQLSLKETLIKGLFIVAIFTATLVGGLYFSNKFLPVAPKKFIFPNHFLFDWLKENGGINRFYGGGTTHIDFNFPTHYQIYGAEGYDTLRLRRYAELLASSFTGSIPDSYLRSDGVFPTEENGKRKRLFELLGVRYLLDKEDNPKTGADWHFERFPNDKVFPIWQREKFQLYERKPVLPRLFLTTKYQVIKDDRQIIEKIYDPSFNLETLLLEEEPEIKIDDVASDIAIPQIVKYEPNEVTISTNVSNSSLLFLSDVYIKDWRVYVDGQAQRLLRAHYALRAVAVPGGSHQVIFKYQPKSFTYGFYASALFLLILALMSLYSAKKKKF